MKNAVKVSNKIVELEGAYECPHCGGHFMADSTYLDQVNEVIHCMYCQEVMGIAEEDSTSDNIIDALMSDTAEYNVNIRGLLHKLFEADEVIKNEYAEWFSLL